MVKFFLIIGLCVAMAWGGEVRVWSEDIEDRFLDPDLDTTKYIFIDVKNVSLFNVLKIFSKQSGLSFIATHDVADKPITLYINKIPMDQALKMVLDANGLTYEMQADTNVFVVKKKEVPPTPLITKVFQLRYATVSASKLNSTISTSGFNAGSISASGTSASSSTPSTPPPPGGGTGSGSLSTGGLEQVLKDSLSPDGKVVEDVRTNSLIITDRPAQFPAIESTIAKLDVPIPQILIEVEMVDVSKSTADQLGITYGATPLTFTGGSKYENWPFGFLTGGPSSSSSSSSGSTSSSSSGSSSGSTATTGWNANGMTAALNFLSTKTDSKILARPRILTLNNETAQIEISTDQAVDIQVSSAASGSSGSVSGYTVDRATTGVILKVTPQANLLTEEVTMAVSPKDVDLVQSALLSPTGGPIYDPQTRGSDSILKLRDGQSMVIGGLMTSQNTTTVTKLPFLGDLPVVGAAFRSKNKTVSNRELIIFLTPHIIEDPNQLTAHKASTRTQAISNSLDAYELKQY